MTLFSGVHREPGTDLKSRHPLIHQLNSGTVLFRLHLSRFGALHFGTTATYRFDDPAGDYGVMYAGLDVHCAFIETFGQMTGISGVEETLLRERTLTELRTTSSLRLIDLCSSGGLARIGADAGLCSGGHGVSQRWSAALRAHPLKPDGILYPPRHDPARSACAIFDSPDSTFECTSRGSLLDHGNAELLGMLLNCYDLGLIPQLGAGDDGAQ